MRLYLSSFRVGDHPDRLLRLRRTERPVAVIANAVDSAGEEQRAASVQLEVDALTALGLTTEELDLRDHVGDSQALAERLRGYEVAWVRGGNVWVLREALARSGGDEVIPALLAEDALVYAGYSAGPCVLAPNLAGLELCDPVEAVRTLYGTEPVTEGLGVLDHAFVPHLDSPGHPETDLLARVAALYRANGVPHVTLRDGQVLVIDGDTRELL